MVQPKKKSSQIKLGSALVIETYVRHVSSISLKIIINMYLELELVIWIKLHQSAPIIETHAHGFRL